MKERRTVVVAWLFCLSLLAVGVVPIATATDSWGTQGVQQIGSSNGGNVTTAVELGGNGTDRIRAVAKTAEGGAVLVGQTDSFGGNTDGWVVSLDSDGNERWNRTVGGPGFETFSGLHATADGEYVAVGSTRSTVDGSTDVYAAKFDGDGDVVWADSYGGPRYDEAHAVVAADGGYTLAGATRSRGRGGLSGWVLHLDESGVPAWNQTYGSVADDVANDIDATGDGYVIAGATESGSATSDAWILRLGPDGQQRWERAVGKQRPTTAGAVVPLDNTDGYVVVGSQAPGGGGPTDAWVTRIDADGTSVWNRTYGGDGPDTAVDAALTDGTPAFVGTTTTGDGTRDPWLVKLGTNGRQRSVTVVQTDGRERIRTLAGRDRQFAVVGSTGERNAQGVVMWTAVRGPTRDAPVTARTAVSVVKGRRALTHLPKLRRRPGLSHPPKLRRRPGLSHPPRLRRRQSRRTGQRRRRQQPRR